MPRCARRFPTEPTPSSTRWAVSCPNPHCDRCGRGGRFVTVGFASGVIPRIPLNLVLVKGVQILGFQFQDVAPNEFARNERRTDGPLVSGRVVPHVGAVYPLAETASALSHVADGKAIGKVLITF